MVSIAFVEETDKAPPPDMLALDSPAGATALVVKDSEVLKLMVHFTDVAKKVGNQEVRFKVEEDKDTNKRMNGDENGISRSVVAPVLSHPIRIVPYKLELDPKSLKEKSEEYNTSLGHYVWHKNGKGGMGPDTAIRFPVKLVDAAGTLALDRKVPLTARLLYNKSSTVKELAGKEVSAAGALKVFKYSSINDAGEGFFNVRIELVRDHGSLRKSVIVLCNAKSRGVHQVHLSSL